VFTGLIEHIGTVQSVADITAGREVRVACPYEDLSVGESIALNGVCLTVLQRGAGWFTVAAASMTTDRTTIGTWQPGRKVHLERALRVGDRAGGHFVQGHVDGVAAVRARSMPDTAVLLDLELPAGLEEFMVPLGSVAVDGVSLTVNALGDGRVLQVALIEHTLRHTVLGDLAPGEGVHIEADVIGKYLHHLAAPYRTGLGANVVRE
jgi:riboflavin synthase